VIKREDFSVCSAFILLKETTRQGWGISACQGLNSLAE
jgi:hypothetical protein